MITRVTKLMGVSLFMGMASIGAAMVYVEVYEKLTGTTFNGK